MGQPTTQVASKEPKQDPHSSLLRILGSPGRVISEQPPLPKPRLLQCVSFKHPEVRKM